jgi:hypothetical protein
MNYYQCPVCGYDKLTQPPESWYVCPCCGTEFELHDYDRTHAELRMEWIEKGLPWFSRAILPPKDWSPYAQLIEAGYGAELLKATGAATKSERQDVCIVGKLVWSESELNAFNIRVGMEY